MLPGNTSPCWGSANSTGTALLTMFKFDVLHLLPKLLDSNNNWTGRRLVNDLDLTTNYPETGTQPYGLHTVTLREGSGDPCDSERRCRARGDLPQDKRTAHKDRHV